MKHKSEKGGGSSLQAETEWKENSQVSQTTSFVVNRILVLSLKVLIVNLVNRELR